ncbi:MAG: cyclic nucleotide-binding domain-containing protein [Armatimonadota bacterium]|nr:cyclic nucleotide-binding domain-containing protein [Armatimonadota bacterium]MDR7485238.1 cyclic nucleotide-binding domain-containing protein [Armatimonadota bacterium]MDR7534198.1 cyclic nucleotide-binding domain-containing protein [Armatimonadota bacterium]MDR7536514.1 cyclic nucleotide-binding domain-containing protein [Armatimonadota bacterium]
MPLTRKRKGELLRGVALFSSLTERGLATVADKAIDIEYAPGQYIVRQGQVGTGVYLIVSGRARVVRGRETLAHLGPGDFFGELSVLDQQPRVAHVVAEEPTTCLALASWDFAKVLERHPRIALALLRGMAQRLRAATASVRY